MALYSASCSNVQLTSTTNVSADCLVTCLVPTTPPVTYQISTTVNVAIGASVATTNTNILNAAVAEIQRVYSIAANTGGADAKGLAGGRTI